MTKKGGEWILFYFTKNCVNIEAFPNANLPLKQKVQRCKSAKVGQAIFSKTSQRKQIQDHLRKLMHPLLHFIIVYIGIWSMSSQEVSLIMYLCSLPFCLFPWFNETVHVCAFNFFFLCRLPNFHFKTRARS